MKIKFLVITFAFLISNLPAVSEETNNKLIVSLMEFPRPVIDPFKTINDPLFAVNFENKNSDNTEIKKLISNLEKKLNDNKDPIILYKLGKYYKSIDENAIAIKFFKKFPGIVDSSSGLNFIDFESNIIRGDIFLSLSEIDSNTNKIANLEKALLFFTKAVELKPDNNNGWIKLGDCYLLLQRISEALLCYKKVMDNNKEDFHIYSRLQAASFQRYYLKLLESKNEENIYGQQIVHGVDFDYLQIAINNSSNEFKDTLKLQHYIYLLRLLLLKTDYNNYNDLNNSAYKNRIFSNDEKTLIDEAEKFIELLDVKLVNDKNLKYLKAVVSLLKFDYKNSFNIFMEISKENKNTEILYNEILLLSVYLTEEDFTNKSFIETVVNENPDPRGYLTLAWFEFRNKNLKKAEMLCNQSLKLNDKLTEVYAGISVIEAMKGNYAVADEMMIKGKFLIQYNIKNKILYNQMMINEAIIALLKNEKERAYILLRSVLSVDNNGKALELYNRYIIKNEKF